MWDISLIDQREFKDVCGKTCQNIHEIPTSAVCHFHGISAENISSNCSWVSILENILSFMEKGMLLTCKPLSTSKNQAGWVDQHTYLCQHLFWCAESQVSCSASAHGPPPPIFTPLSLDCFLCTVSPSLPFFPSAQLPRADWQAHRIRLTVLCQTGTSFLTHLRFHSFSHSFT